ncbi:MAG: replication restart helicase PriA [Planctomycetota bacterium]|jgi:primosomal protein N' (replication factor Y)
MIRNRTNSLFETKEESDLEYNHIIRVAIESGVDSEFDYVVPRKLWPVEVGQRVKVPFGRGNKLQNGFCVVSEIKAEESFISRGAGRKLKVVTEVMDKEPLLNDKLMELARWISVYYVCPLGQVLAAMVPSAVKKGAGVEKKRLIYLAGGWEELAEGLRGKKQKQIIDLLQVREAYIVENAVGIEEVLNEVGCKVGPVKSLAQKLIVKQIVKEVLKDLPAIPEGMVIKSDAVALNQGQKKAYSNIKEKIESDGFGVTLLHGVTDSGKTELYIRAIEYCLKKGRSAVVLLPEIALTAQTVQRFSSRFERIAVMHSGLTSAQRSVQWRKIKNGDADVVIGARSAVFAPLCDPGLIVVDEEHEPSYKQDTVPRYNGRDVAIKRAQLHNAHCILGSATPSLETLFNCREKKYFSIERLTKRVMELPMPEMKLVDMKRQCLPKDGMKLISDVLAERLTEVLARGEQAILLLNRRGYSNFVFCPSCNYTLHCRNCDVSFTFHKSKKITRMKTVMGKHMDYGHAVCHYCGSQTLVPEKCPLCSKGMAMIGVGSQRLEEELAQRFPQARVRRVDSDSMAGKNYYRVLGDFGRGEIDILAGTQILAKGLHFPNVTLVGIISADTSLYVPDFRANERTFQLISQVAGRTGRSQKKGVVYVQTFLPDQPAIRFAINNDFKGFVEEELKHRRQCNLPPFWRIAVMIIRGTDFEKLEAACKQIRERVNSVIKRYGLEIKVRGPMPAVISRVQRFHRMQIILQAPKADFIQELFRVLRTEKPAGSAVKVAIDIDPVNLL